MPDYLIRDPKDGRLLLVVLLHGWKPEAGQRDAGHARWMQQQLTDYLVANDCATAMLVRKDRTYLLARVPGEDGKPGLETRASACTDALMPLSCAQGETRDLLDTRVNHWLEALATTPETAFAGQQDFQKAWGTETLEAVRGGRVVWELGEECKRRRASKEPGYSGRQVQELLRALEEEWQQTGGFDQDHLDVFLNGWRAGARE